MTEVCGVSGYQERLTEDLNEMGGSEMWRAGKATRDLRPKEEAQEITAETRGGGVG